MIPYGLGKYNLMKMLSGCRKYEGVSTIVRIEARQQCKPLAIVDGYFRALVTKLLIAKDIWVC